MIPLSDVDRRPLRLPIVTMSIIALNGLVFLTELALGPSFIMRWSVVPSQIAGGHHLLTVFSAMFLHAGWMHIIGNMVFLWAFGPEIEDIMGRSRYLIFYLLGGVVATAAQVAAIPDTNIPNLGASGAIAAVMGAFMITFPRDRIRTLVFIFIFVTTALIPAALLVGFWFAMELFSELGSLVERHAGGVAYMAHIGGFLFGLIFAKLFERRPDWERIGPRTMYYNQKWR